MNLNIRANVEPAELHAMAAVADDVAARLRAANAELEGAGIIEGSAWGPKMARKLEVVATRLDYCAKAYRRHQVGPQRSPFRKGAA
jgi:hypothetical protein